MIYVTIQMQTHATFMKTKNDSWIGASGPEDWTEGSLKRVLETEGRTLGPRGRTMSNIRVFPALKPNTVWLAGFQKLLGTECCYSFPFVPVWNGKVYNCYLMIAPYCILEQITCFVVLQVHTCEKFCSSLNPIQGISPIWFGWVRWWDLELLRWWHLDKVLDLELML